MGEKGEGGAERGGAGCDSRTTGIGRGFCLVYGFLGFWDGVLMFEDVRLG